MPTYDYRCKDCGHELEVVQSFTDDALTTCEQCGGALRKLFGSVGISFKGSGFYKNDSRSPAKSGSSNGGSSSGDAKPSESTSSESTSSDSSSSGTKPADTKATPAKAAAATTSGS